MKIITVVGARPQFIKAAPVSKALKDAGHHEILVHTGQHYDNEMSEVFFKELEIAHPHVNLAIGSGGHGQQTGRMLEEIERVILNEEADLVLVYGDTNSTLAGALAAIKLHIPVAHVEAGLRSFNREMPEEHNRRLTDHSSEILFCPTKTAVANLANEGITENVHLVGDTMYDAVLQFSEIASKKSAMLGDLGLDPKGFYLATIHRPYNTDVYESLSNIFSAFAEMDLPVVFPVHPRTRQKISSHFPDLAADANNNIKMIKPLGYLDMLALMQDARIILTDSGGIQKEAFFLGVPCVTLRPETEWVETVEAGWNILTGSDKAAILDAVLRKSWPARASAETLFGDGKASQKIVQVLSSSI